MGLTLQRKIHPINIICLLIPLFGCATCECSVVIRSWLPGVLILGPLGRGSCAGQSQLLPMTVLELPARSYKAIHSWSLPVLDLKVCGRVHAENPGPLPPLLGLGQLNETPREPETRCTMPAVHVSTRIE